MADLDPSQSSFQLESRLSEGMFRRYEPLLTKAVANFPNETSFTIPPDISPTTFLARFRDARLSLLKFDWKPTTVNREKLITIQAEHTISYDHSTRLVWFRAKQQRGRPKTLVVDTISHGAPTSSLVWPDCTTEELTAACLLISVGKLSGSITISRVVDPTIILDLTTRFNVGIVTDNEQTILM